MRFRFKIPIPIPIPNSHERPCHRHPRRHPAAAHHRRVVAGGAVRADQTQLLACGNIDADIVGGDHGAAERADGCEEERPRHPVEARGARLDQDRHPERPGDEERDGQEDGHPAAARGRGRRAVSRRPLRRA